MIKQNTVRFSEIQEKCSKENPKFLKPKNKYERMGGKSIYSKSIEKF